jgi:hypothetical protein
LISKQFALAFNLENLLHHLISAQNLCASCFLFTFLHFKAQNSTIGKRNIKPRKNFNRNNLYSFCLFSKVEFDVFSHHF